MTVLNATSSVASSDSISSLGFTVYADARTGGGGATLSLLTQADCRVGQRFATPNYSCYESFLEFDTSSIPADAVISSAVLTLYMRFADAGGGAFTVEARLNDHGATVTTADYVSGASLSGKTLLASLASGSFPGGYTALTDVAMAANVVKAGTTRIILCSSKHTAGTTPTGDEWLTFWTYDATNPAKLDVTYTVPAIGNITGTDRGTGNNAVSSTTLVVTPDSTLAPGSMGVLCVALDNSGSGGATAASPATATDSVGNVWTRRLNPIYDPGAVNAGCELAIYTAPILFAFGAANTLTLTWAGAVSVPSKAWTLQELSATGATLDYVTGAAGTGAASAAPTVTTSSLTSGDCVIGAGASESTNTWAGDADTTNGTWSTHQTNGAGTGATGMAVTSQRKIVTATATQTYNPTLTSADQIIGWISVRATVMVPPAVRIAALQAVQRASSW